MTIWRNSGPPYSKPDPPHGTGFRVDQFGFGFIYLLLIFNNTSQDTTTVKLVQLVSTLRLTSGGKLWWYQVGGTVWCGSESVVMAASISKCYSGYPVPMAESRYRLKRHHQ